MRRRDLPSLCLAGALGAGAALLGVSALLVLPGLRVPGEPPDAVSLVTLRQVSAVPGPSPLLERTFVLSNGTRRAISFFPPDPRTNPFFAETFCTNSRMPHGGWDPAPDEGLFRDPAVRKVSLPPGRIARFSVETPDDRRPRDWILPVFGAGFRGRRALPMVVSTRGAARVATNVFDASFADRVRRAPSLHRLSRRADGTTLLDGRPYDLPALRKRLERLSAEEMGGCILDLPKSAPAREWLSLRDLCRETLNHVFVATPDAPVVEPNPMSREWRFRRDSAAPGPSVPTAMVSIGNDGAVALPGTSLDGVLCSDSDLADRISELTDAGALALFVQCGPEAPCGVLSRVVGAYRNIGGVWFSVVP